MARPRTQPAVCQAVSCGAPATSSGLCDRHSWRLAYYGSANTPTRHERCAQRAADLAWLVAHGVSAGEALARVGWTHKAAVRWAYRHDRGLLAVLGVAA